MYIAIGLLHAHYRYIIHLTPEDLLPAVYLAIGRLGPAYEPLELGNLVFLCVRVCVLALISR